MTFVKVINFKMPTIVGILKFITRINVMLLWVEHERHFITSGPALIPQQDDYKTRKDTESRFTKPGPTIQASPTADPGVASLSPPRSNTIVEIDHEIISTVILLLLLIQEGLSVTSKSMCMKYWLTV